VNFVPLLPVKILLPQVLISLRAKLVKVFSDYLLWNYRMEQNYSLMYDCIIVGAGPAGGTAAYHLSRVAPF